TSQTTTSAKATVSSTQKKTKATSSTSSRPQTAATRSSKTARERASAANKSVTQPTATTRLAALNQQLTKTLGKQALVPQVDGLTSGSSKLNMRYSGDTANYTIHYSVGQQAQPFNA
ncbi:hypothetical protein J8137_23915, partial [Lactiplantibacillus plantarum]|nr:hypothetical protein [Lactiplantibacillus plantarum]